MLADALVRSSIAAAESGWVPDAAIRAGIREVCRRRLRAVGTEPELASEAVQAFVDAMARGPIAQVPELANAQHYEVPAAFFEAVLGPALKYSCCYWERAGGDLAEAEQASLARTCDNAQLADGQRILELGCGWGSLTLYMAARYPGARIVAVSNSASQRAHITGVARSRGLANVDVVTADINDFAADGAFDRVVSVEMFEHVRNHAALLERIAGWLAPAGKLLVHVFCSGGAPYAFEDDDADDWMARTFFSGGVMPSDDLLLRYQKHLVVERQWRWSGDHYRRTADAWLANLDRVHDAAAAALAGAGEAAPARAIQRWRMFFMACSELFGFDRGRRWWVSHYRFAHR